MSASLRAPLGPAGHLPLKGGDQAVAEVAINRKLGRWALRYAEELGTGPRRLIFPLEGEMAGRPVGGNVERGLDRGSRL